MVAKTLAEIDALDKTDGRAMALQMERIHHHVTERALVKTKASLESCQQELHMVRGALTTSQ